MLAMRPWSARNLSEGSAKQGSYPASIFTCVEEVEEEDQQQQKKGKKNVLKGGKGVWLQMLRQF
jgi:hypothetical protein